MYKKINNEKDLKDFLQNIGYFHDGVIHSFSYISGSYGDADGIFPNDNKRELILEIQGCPCGKIMLKFCDIIRCNIIPTMCNQTSEIYQSNIQIIDGNFIFAQEVDNLDDTIKLSKQNKITIISEKLSYQIIPY